jgi:FkbM family methyltransferase
MFSSHIAAIVPAAIRSNPAAIAVWRAFKDPYLDDTVGRRISSVLPWWKRQTVVQIGTNDGKRGDPISTLLHHRRRWRALLVEPLPKYFNQLVNNYGSSHRFMFEQSAVGTTNGRLSFYHLDEDRARLSPHWRDHFDRIGSLNQSNLIFNLGDCADAMTPYITETDVNVLSVDSLLKKWKIDWIDALIVDAEGCDWGITRQVLERRIRPRVVVFEHTHFSIPDRAASFKALELDYSIEQLERDYVCLLKS